MDSSSFLRLFHENLSLETRFRYISKVGEGMQATIGLWEPLF